VKKKSLILILCTYFIFSLTTLFFWDKQNIYNAAGDEPHYLMISNSLGKYGSLEQTAAYKDEFKSRDIYKYGLASENEEPSPQNTHAVVGPHGLYNVHNIGLPILLIFPFMLGGVIGAKLGMILLGSLVIIFSWKFSAIFSQSENLRFWTVFVTCISLPLLPASTQIYPDIIAGMIAMIGLYWFYTSQEKRLSSSELVFAVAISFLPWLQIKFVVTCCLIVLAVAVKIYLESQNFQRVFRIVLIMFVSCLGLAIYNYCAFGKVSGPYQSGALEFSKTSFMVLLGLYLDQNHGFLLQNPIHFIGIFGIAGLYKVNRAFFVLWGMVFLSLIVPNALHPNWYGGGSFSGRFEWAASVVFFIPTICTLAFLGERSRQIFTVAIILGNILQIYFFYRYTFTRMSLYNRVNLTQQLPTPENYAVFYKPIHSWLPMLYNSEWAFSYKPNYAWIAGTLALFFLGIYSARKLPRQL
jgi:hypothetical protein